MCDVLVQLRQIPADQLVDARELAAIGGWSLRTTQRWVRRLDVQPVPVPGTARRYRVGDLVAAIAHEGVAA
ncbi:MAG: hypothetical protein AB7P61_07575 [Gemmatimonadales bacterium]